MTELRKLYLYDPTTSREAKFDSMTDAIAIVDYAHHEIHGGSSFSADVYVEAGTQLNICFKTPAGTKRAHMLFEFASESKSVLYVFEGSTWTTNTGTVYAPINQNRGSANESILLEDKTATPDYTANGVLLNATTVVTGDIVDTVHAPGTKQSGGASGSKREELVLKPDETYRVFLGSLDGSKDLFLKLLWYEHTDAA